jgi:branched-chain amino acid transport system substrate-binding protein
MKFLSRLVLLTGLLLAGCANPFDSELDDLKTVRQVKAVCRDLLHFKLDKKPHCEASSPATCVNGIKLPKQCLQIAKAEELLSTPEIRIAYVQSSSPISELSHILDGIFFAANRVNESGGIYGRPLQIDVIQDSVPVIESFTKTISVKVAENLDTVAVFGHYESEEALPSSITYEREGLLFLSAYAGNSALTNHRFRMTFSTTPNNDNQAEDLVHYAVSQNWRRIAIFFTVPEMNNPAEKFEATTVRYKLPIVIKKAIFPGKLDYRDDVADLTKKHVDGILVAAKGKDARNLISAIRQFKITQPILGFRYLASKDTRGDNNLVSLGTVLAPVLEFDVPTVLKGMAGFQEKYGYTPDLWAARGYDNLMLLADAIKKTKATSPEAIANTLRYLDQPWVGLAGAYQFDENGTLKSQNYQIVDIKTFFN